MYALNIDKGSHKETRNAACQDSYYAFLYARDIDKCLTEETWLAIKGTQYEEEYRRMFNYDF
jgi:sarcosine oxidase delta subunit